MSKNARQLLLFVAVYMGWQLLPNGPLAYYVAQAALSCLLALQVGYWLTGAAWVVYLFGAALAASTAGCGALFAAQADARHFLCDAGTGLPVSSFTGALALLVALYLLKEGRRHGS